MSSNQIVLNTGQQAIVNYDVSKIFVFGNRYENDQYINNSGYDPITLLAGTVMGRIASSGVLVPLKSDASDGSQYPIGVLAQDLIIDSGATVTAAICVSGDVAQDKVIFVKPGDGLETTVSSRRLKDRLAADTVGIKLVPSSEMTAFDNQ